MGFRAKMEKLLTNVQFSKNHPSGSFLPKYLEDNGNVESNIDGFDIAKHLICSELPNASFDFDPDFSTHVYAAGFTHNGKSLSIFEQHDSVTLSMHQYQFKEDGLIEISNSSHSHSWLIRDYDYVISHDASYVVMFNSEENAHERDHRRRRKRGYGLGEKVYISLLVFNQEIPKGTFFPNLNILSFSNPEDSTDSQSFLKYKHGYCIDADGNVIISTWGLTRDTLGNTYSNGDALYLNFFNVNISDCKVSIEHKHQTDLTNNLFSLPFPVSTRSNNDPLIQCNQKMTKILIQSHNLVYILGRNVLYPLAEECYSHCYWVVDEKHGEVLISIDRPSFSLINCKVFKQDDNTDNYSIISQFCVKDVFNHNEDHEPSYHCHAVNNRDVYLFIEPKRLAGKVYAVNVFTRTIDFVLIIPRHLKEPYVRKVLVAGTQILILISEDEKEVICVYQKKLDKTMKSLKTLSALETLKTYSFNQMLSLNIPQLLLRYLEELWY